jgi:hypothetical protein
MQYIHVRKSQAKKNKTCANAAVRSAIRDAPQQLCLRRAEKMTTHHVAVKSTTTTLELDVSINAFHSSML